MRSRKKLAAIVVFVAFGFGLFLLRSVGVDAQNTEAPFTSGNQQKDQFPTNLNLDCAGCHGAGKSLPYLAGQQFHKDTHGAMDTNIHAKPLANGKPAATCLDCHTVKGDMSTILPGLDPRSTVSRANISQTCGRCHNDPALMASNGISNRPFLAYQESVHGKALSMGNLKAAVCSDCHTSHNVLPANDARSSISKFNVAKTCGTCHGQISMEFTNSVHGTSLARGNYQAPNCTDCHGIHGIKAQKENRAELGLVSCSQCHDGVRLAQDFGIPKERVTSFKDSYHGRASKLGSDVVADCASCHGVHNILPSSDPKSLINKANLVSTCGQCHLGAGDNFAIGRVHLETAATEDLGSQGKYWVRNIYLFLIFGIVGGMLVHNGVIWYRKAVAKRDKEHRPIVRMTVNQRVQHWLLLTSFVVLLFTGFALEYPDSFLGWLSGNSESIRRVIHRVAAVVMMVVGVYHLVYLMVTREGRSWTWDMLPRWKDVTDFLQNFKHFVLNKGERPRFARFRYADKAEYWAVVWGTVIMGLTGLMIWFKVGIFGFLPRWAIDIAIAIHFYEAILATLAIVVWHFYHVIFDPDVYPINWAFYDGRISEELFREEHEEAYEEMIQQGATDSENPSTPLDDTTTQDRDSASNPTDIKDEPDKA